MRRSASLLLACVVLCVSSRALAGGFYLLPRGVRGVSQGGAMVAGSDSPDALWYNPAGLATSKKQFLFDLVLPIETVDFTRIDSGGETEPKVTMTSKPLPLPGIAYSDNFGLEKLTFGFGLFAPPAALLTYPQGVLNPDTKAIEPPPQGYSALGMEGSALLFLNAGVAYRPHPAVSLGASVGVLVGKFQARVLTFLADGGAMGQPESEEYARPTTFGTDVLVRPTGSFGTVISLADIAELRLPVRIGASFQLPVAVAGPGSFDIDLPDSGLYRDAKLSSHRVDVRLDFPWILRVGIEAKPTRDLRVELSYTREAWSMQDAIDVKSHIRIDNVPVLESYTVGDLRVARKLKDTQALALGGEYALLARLVLRAGLMLESGSMTKATMSVLTPDPNKLAVSLGAGYELFDGVWVDAVVGHLFMQNVSVPQGTSRIYRLEALRPPLQSCAGAGMTGAGCPVPLGDGKYALEASYVGAGLRWLFDR